MAILSFIYSHPRCMQYCERLRNSCKNWNIEVWIMLSEDVSLILLKKPQSFLLYMSRSSPSISCVWIIRFYLTTWNAIRQAWLLLKCKGTCAQHFVFYVAWHTPIVIRLCNTVHSTCWLLGCNWLMGPRMIHTAIRKWSNRRAFISVQQGHWNIKFTLYIMVGYKWPKSPITAKQMGEMISVEWFLVELFY